MLFKFRRMRAMDPLQVAMTGVRMGERFLQIGCADASLLSGLATKVGLSGSAAVFATTAGEEERAKKAGARAGALIDVRAGAPSALPFGDGAFDMVVIDDTRGGFAELADDARQDLVRESWRVLRVGGRVELVEGVGSGGFFSASPSRPHGYAAEAALAAGGFAPVRALAEKDGFRFVEGLKAVKASA